MAIYSVIAYTTTDLEVIIRTLAGSPDRAIKRCLSIAKEYDQEPTSMRVIACVGSMEESMAIHRSCDPLRDGLKVF